MSRFTDARDGFKEGMAPLVRPECVTEEHLQYLDELRESGVVNMFGAMPYLQDTFPDLTTKEAAAVMGYWMKSFSYRHSK